MELEAALKSALIFEKRIRDLYIEAAAGTDDTAGKKIFQDLAEDEQNHVSYLESRLESGKNQVQSPLKDWNRSSLTKPRYGKQPQTWNPKSIKIHVA